MRFFRRGGSLRMLLTTMLHSRLIPVRWAPCSLRGKRVRRRSATFQLLTIYDALGSFDYWFLPGECAASSKHWGERIYAYGRAAQIKIDAPQAPWAAAECYRV